MKTRRPTTLIRIAAPLIIIVCGVSAFFYYLLRRFPYDGLYGQDAFAYYYQARAIFEEALRIPPAPNALYSANGLQHWPVGYHLQIIAGFLLGGEGLGGPRLLTVAMAVASPLLVYAIFGLLVPRTNWAARFVGGLAAAALVPLNATFTRMGLSLMSDIPSLFWILLAVYAFLRIFPPLVSADDAMNRRTGLWAAIFGGSLGLAILTRYGAAPILAPLVCYLVVRQLAIRPRMGRSVRTASVSVAIKSALIGLTAFALALLPQAIYLRTHDPGTGLGDYMSGISLANIFSSSTTSVDGTSTFAQPMYAFYLLNPFWDTAAGYLSLFFLPLVLFGLVFLAARRSWQVLALLLIWWLVPGLFYAATPYQAQRFTLLYLPAIAIALGLGVYLVLDVAWHAISSRVLYRAAAWSVIALLLLLCLSAGTVSSWQSVRDWMATHSAWQADDQALVAKVRAIAKDTPSGDSSPHLLTFAATAALYHYTQWPTLELYNADQRAVQSFISTSPANLVVVPADALNTQWAGTPLGNLWTWMQTSYNLSPLGTSGNYTIYQLIASRH